MDYKQESQKLKQKLHSEIKNLIDQGYSYNEVAKELNLTPQHVNYIVQKHLKGGEAK